MMELGSCAFSRTEYSVVSCLAIVRKSVVGAQSQRPMTMSTPNRKPVRQGTVRDGKGHANSSTIPYHSLDTREIILYYISQYNIIQTAFFLERMNQLILIENFSCQFIIVPTSLV